MSIFICVSRLFFSPSMNQHLHTTILSYDIVIGFFSIAKQCVKNYYPGRTLHTVCGNASGSVSIAITVFRSVENRRLHWPWRRVQKLLNNKHVEGPVPYGAGLLFSSSTYCTPAETRETRRETTRHGAASRMNWAVMNGYGQSASRFVSSPISDTRDRLTAEWSKPLGLSLKPTTTKRRKNQLSFLPSTGGIVF